MNANVLIASASNCLRKGGNVVSLYILVTVPIKELPFSLALYLRAGFYFGISFHSSNRLCNS